MKTQMIQNAMREAFMNVRIKRESHLSGLILNALAGKAGMKHYGRGWSFNGSLRMTKKLMNEGILG